MKDFSVNDIFASVKCQFVRRCSHSEIILGRLADDFIARYSAKSRPHPQFFKEDAALTHNQLTMYADECVQVMRKFDFLQRGAEIVQGLSNSTLRLLDFFTKQLYHHLRQAPFTAPSLLQQSLCPSCCRLRENERVRSLKQQLAMGQRWDEEQVSLREMVVRHGEKYDEQELLYQSLENLEVLNEEEIRKRLGKMEADHDKRKKEILVAVEELTRANERVTTYSRALERSGKEFSGKFNMKDYVFQLGRHFYHNISSLDLKIRLLKHSLSPITHQDSQTDQPILFESAHKEIVALMATQTDRIKFTLDQAVKTITIQQNKNSELRQMNALLQQKLQENDVRREEEKIEEKVNSTQISNNLSAAQSKITILETLLRRLKSGKGKAAIIESQPPIEEQTPLSTNRQEQEPDPTIQKPYRNNTGHLGVHFHKQKESFLINPKALLRLSQIKSMPGIKSITQQFTDRLFDVVPSIPQILNKICEESRSKFTLVSTLCQSYIPFPKALSSKAVSRKISKKLINYPPDSLYISQAQSRIDFAENERSNEKQPIHHKERKKLSKLDIGKHDYVRSSKHRESIHIDDEMVLENLKKKTTQCALAFQDLRNTFDEKSKLPTKKMLGTIKTSIGLQTFKSTHDKQLLKKQFAQRILLQKRNKHKKARNLSQENSYEYQNYQDLRKSIQKMDYKEKPIFGQKQRHLLLNPNDSEAKISFKNSVYRNDGARIVLSLEEINYSTYFYSLLANIHLKSHLIYENVRKFMVGLVPGLNDDDSSIKESLNFILLAHRKCSSGPICHHLEAFLEKIKNT